MHFLVCVHEVPREGSLELHILLASGDRNWMMGERDAGQT